MGRHGVELEKRDRGYSWKLAVHFMAQPTNGITQKLKLIQSKREHMRCQGQVAHSKQTQYGIAYEATTIIILLPARQQYSKVFSIRMILLLFVGNQESFVLSELSQTIVLCDTIRQKLTVNRATRDS